MKQILLAFIIALSFNCHAQTFTNYTSEEGLINNAVNCVAVNSKNEIWFGTQGGLSLFDGNQTWTNYNKASHPDLIDDVIKAVAVDDEDNLWVGTDFGVSKFDGTNWTSFTESDGLADDRIKFIRQGPAGNIWFANNDGISIFDGVNWENYVMADGIPFGGTNYVIFDEEDNAWLGTPLAGVIILDGTNFSSITENEGLLNNKIRSIAIDKNQNKWIGNADGISVYNENNEFVIHHELIFELPPPDSLNPVEDIVVGLDGRIWVGVYVDYLVTVGGVSMFSNQGEDWVDYDQNDGLVGPVVRRLDVDDYNQIWVTTSTGVTKIGDLPSSNNNVEIQNQLNIYPNPNSGVFNISGFNTLENLNYRVYDNFGRLVKNGRLVNNNQLEDWRDLEPGIYSLIIENLTISKIVIGR